MRSCALLAVVVLGVAALRTAPVQAERYVEQGGATAGHLESVWPPVVQRGTSGTWEFSGEALPAPWGMWTSLPDGALQVPPATITGPEQPAERQKLAYTLSPQAPLGVYGLRLASRSGLTNVHLFVVDELPVTLHEAATDGPPRRVALPASVAARVRPAGYDEFEIEVPAGQRVAFEVVGHRLGHDFDPVVSVWNAQGALLAEHDNNPGLMCDCRFEHIFAAAGVYRIRVHDLRYQSEPGWCYVLRMGDFPVGTCAVPSVVPPAAAVAMRSPQGAGRGVELVPVAGTSGLALRELRFAGGPAAWFPLLTSDRPSLVEAHDAQSSNATAEQAPTLPIPGYWQGILTQPGERDWVALELKKGDKISFQGEARGIGSPADLELTLFNPMQKEIRRVDDNGEQEAGFSFTAGEDGRHTLQIRDVTRDGGPDFAYRIEIRLGTEQLSVLAEMDQLVVPQGTYQPLPLKVTRTDFQGPIELTLRGAPPGVTLSPTTIPAEATELICQVQAAADAPLGLSTLQVVARAVVGERTIEALARVQPLVDRQWKNVDQIPYGLRENQKRLPLSLTEQFPLQIVEPAPYTLELPEQQVVLARYLTAAVPLPTTATTGAGLPLTFRIRGGQFGSETEFRNQLYARFPLATTADSSLAGTLYTRNLANNAKHRVDLFATAAAGERQITLHRTFQLEVRSAYEVKQDPPKVSGLPGAKVQARFVVTRLPGFAGNLEMTPNFAPLWQLPQTLTIPADQPEITLDVAIPATMNPGVHRVQFVTTGQVGEYQESINSPTLEIEVLKPEPPKNP